MGRSAESSISGYLYQFCVFLNTLLKSGSDDQVTIEGVNEDIEIEADGELALIQCKYHESSDGFSLSSIYKPILQMMAHFGEAGAPSGGYRLYCHFPGSNGRRAILPDELSNVISTKNADLKKWVDKAKGVDVVTFSSVVYIEFGPSLTSLAQIIIERLQIEFPEDSAEFLHYPNAIQMIADIACDKNVTSRAITKRKLIDQLNLRKKIVITKWTRALHSYEKMLRAKRKEISNILNVNARIRYFLLGKQLIDYDKEMINFIGLYVQKFFSKSAHQFPPLFCVDSNIADVKVRLRKNGIKCADGYTADYFEEDDLFRPPFMRKSGKVVVERDFHIRLLNYKQIELISRHKPNDLFVVGDRTFDLDCRDVNVEFISVNSFNHLEYVLHLRGDLGYD